MNKLLLIDGNSIMNRAFYGLPLLTDNKGRYTNAVFGFLNILLRTIEDENPSHVLIAFDTKAPTFRHKEFDQYKGNRGSMPEELVVQMPLIKETLKKMNIVMYEQEGIEADDILGTLSLEFEKNGFVTILSGDRDMLQLASDHTKISIPRTKAGQTTTEHYFFKDFVDAYGFTPAQFIDVKGMMGDTSDNIPGIPGIGEKTAHKFVIEYQSLEGLYEHAHELKGKTQEKVMLNKDLAFLSRHLATIKRDCDLALKLDELELKNYYTPEAFDWFKELNFIKLLAKFDFNDIENVKETPELEIQLCTDYDTFIRYLTEIDNESSVAFFDYCEENYVAFSVSSIYRKKEKRYAFESDHRDLAKEYIVGIFSELQKKERVVFYDLKQCLHRYAIDEAVVPKNYEDVLLMYYLEKPNKSDYSILDLGLSYSSITFHQLEDLIGKGKSKVELASLSPEVRIKFLAQGVSIIQESFKPLYEALDEAGMTGLYNTLEKPLLMVLYSMEKEGIHVDLNILKQQSDGLADEIAVLEKNIYELAGEEFNINSPKQLGVILFDTLGLPFGTKTKTGYSTNADVLEKLIDKHPIIKQILHYRQLAKLKSTYADGLAAFIKEDGKIHTTFNQTIASTGRLSSTDPNLQNIPIRLEQGRLIRKAFLPKNGYVFIDADYSQIELRILAHISEDPNFMEAFRQNIDVHSMTASQVFHVPLEEVDSTMRRNAKAVNFGIVYGISDYGLSRDLGIPISESKRYIEAYFSNYAKVKEFLDETVANAYKDGFVTTMYNRKRIITELSNSNYMQRQFGERIAMNTPIQGSAADIIKIAMIKVYKRLKKENLDAVLILQVHDELIIEAHESIKEQVMKLLIEEMENAVKLLVPLTVDASIAMNWYDAK
jgi:DNA polymerase I